MKTLLITVLLCCTALAAQMIDSWNWTTSGGGNGWDYGNAVTVDTSGNIYVAGSFSLAASFGNQTWTTTDENDWDIFVGKLDPNGNWLWTARAGRYGQDKATGIALDADGNIYVCGTFSGTVYFGGHLLSSVAQDVFVARLSSSGTWEWAVRAGGAAYDVAYGICVSGGSIRVTGYYHGPATYGTTYLGGNSLDAFVFCLDLSGNWLWAVRGGGAGSEKALGICGDSDGNSWITGSFDSSLATFGTTTLITSGSNDIFVAKLDAAGNWLWASSAGGSSAYDCGNGISIAGEGACYVTGNFGDTATFGTAGTVTAITPPDFFAAKISEDGQWLWARGNGGGSFDVGSAVSTDQFGNCCITGSFSGAPVFDTTTLISSGISNLYVTLLSPTGDWLWAVNAASSASIFGLSVASITGGFLITGAYLYESAQFGTDVLSNSGLCDVYIARLETTLAPALPLAPQNLAISIGGTAVHLSWDPVINDTYGQTVNIDHYVILSSDDPEGVFGSVSISYENSWTGSVNSHNRHFYKVKAIAP